MRSFHLSRQGRTDLTGYAFILPNLVGMTLFVLFPLLFSLFISFTDWDFTRGIGNWSFVGISNYVEMWHDEWFLASLKNTFVFAFTVVPVTIALALVVAVIIDTYCVAKLPAKLAMFLPYISNVTAVAIIWIMMYSPWGPFTQFVHLFVKNPPQWLGDPHWALFSIIVMSIWTNVGYAILIYTSAISGLSRELYEAAEVDGAGAVSVFFHITIPELAPTTFFLVITTMVNSFQVFAPVQIMTRGGPGTSTHVLVYYIYTAAFTFYRMGYAAAISWVLFLILFVITMVQWNGQKRWASYL